MSIKKLLSLALATVVALGVSSVGAVAASAAEPTGSIQITKTTQDGKTTVEGVEYTLYRVNDADNKAIDLSTNEGWAKAQEILTAFNKGHQTADSVEHKTEQGAPQKTNASGVAKFSDLPLGLYLVVESSVADAKVKNLIPGRPFMVTVPTTKKDGKTLEYNIEVSPKNSEVNLEKTVDDSTINTSRSLTYTLKSDIPKVEQGSAHELLKYIVSDKINSNLTVDPKQVKVTVTGDADNTHAATDYNVTVDKGTLKVEFTADGLKKLAKSGAKLGSKVEITVPASLNKDFTVPDNGLILDNEATLEIAIGPNTPGASTPPTITVKSNKVTTPLGKVSVTKVKEDKTTAITDNPATFELYLCKDVNGKPALQGGKLTIDGKSEWNTDKAGKLEISGLQANNWKNGKEVPATERVSYCLKETKAPKGYELAPQPFKFDITYTPGTDQAQGKVVTDLDKVVNYPSNAGFSLPETGATALVALSIAGILMTIGGAFAFASYRRRQA